MGPQKKKRSSAQPIKICLEIPLIIILSLKIDIQTFEGVAVVRGPASVTKGTEAKTPGHFISLPPTKAIRKGIIVAIGAANSLAMPEKRVIGEQAKEVVTTPKKAILNPALKMLPPLNSPSLSLLPNTENLQVGGSLYRFRDK